MILKKIIPFYFFMLLLFCLQTVSNIPFPNGPGIENPLNHQISNTNANLSNDRRAFGYNVFGLAAPLGPFKMYLNSPVITNLAFDPLSANYIAGACFAADGNLYGIRSTSNMLVKIDTATGSITNVGYSGPGTGLAFDWTTNKMFMITYIAGYSQLNTVNLSNGLLTPIGIASSGDIEDIACGNTGNLYGIDVYYDKFIGINKSNGVVSIIGSLGFDASYSQGLSWDHNNDSCYYASFNNSTQKCEMRRVNVTNGSSVVLYSIDAEIDGFAIPWYNITAIGNHEKEIKVFSLSQNYPNPFNPSTKIKFDIPADGKGQTADVKIIVYDITGKQVSVLVNQKFKPGSYEVEWDGINFTSGIYFYKLQTADYTETKKMVLIK
jgi:hypothetical protein